MNKLYTHPPPNKVLKTDTCLFYIKKNYVYKKSISYRDMIESNYMSSMPYLFNLCFLVRILEN